VPANETGRDREWARDVRAGDPTAFEELFRAYYDQLVGFAARLLGDNQAAEEVVQDVFLSVWRNRDRGDIEANNLAAYLYGAVRKTSTSRLRHLVVENRWRQRASQETELHPLGATPAADASAHFNDLIVAVRSAVEELPPRTRQAFLLRRQHGLSYGEIAQVMGISPKTVEVHIGAALRTLRARLARFYD
jgi:RNA polymerase sigma-70 factor (ECF subfamily)